MSLKSSLFVLLGVCGLLAVTIASAQDPKPSGQKGKDPSSENPRVVMKTNMGEITLELFSDKAPVTVENFLVYVREGFYDDTVFHRVIDGFMIQGGGFDEEMNKKPTNKPIKNEADNGLSNTKGTIAMARTSDPQSASSQFFINVGDNSRSLDYKDRSKWGYCVFGTVVDGMEVVDKIKALPVAPNGSHQHYPKSVVVIEKCWVAGDEAKEK